MISRELSMGEKVAILKLRKKVKLIRTTAQGLAKPIQQFEMYSQNKIIGLAVPLF